MMSTADNAWFRIEHESSVGAVRRAAVGLARRLGLDGERARGSGSRSTEVATNQLKHAGGGALLLRACRCRPRGEGSHFVAVDRGPGMSDVGCVPRRRALDRRHARHRPRRYQPAHVDAGHLLAARAGHLWSRRASAVRPDVAESRDAGGLTRPMSGAGICGDAFAVRVDDAVLTAMVADGLGHGPLAATASDAAVRAFLRAPPGPPVELLTAVHRGTGRTRGAAAAVVQAAGDGAVCYAGVGNISGYVSDGRQQRRMISYPGIVGVNARMFRETRYDLPDHGVVLLCSDGVTDKLRLDEHVACWCTLPS